MSTPEHIARLRRRVGHDLIHASAAGTFTFDSERRVLLVRHHTGVWINPGGIVEPFETPADAAMRETWEETGLVVELVRLIGVFSGPDHHVVYPNGDEIAYVSIAFEARPVGGALAPDGHEILEARFFTPAETDRLDASPRVKRALRAALSPAPGPMFDAPRWTPPASPRRPHQP